MTFYIHIGFGKTGTTSIQDFFFHNREALLRKGLVYPEIGLCGTGQHELALLGLNYPPPETEELLVNIRSQIDGGSHHATLISSENLCFMHSAYIRRLAEHFSGINVRIIFYMRAQPQLIESAFLEWQKVGDDYLGTIDRFFAVHRSAFDFLVRITPWVEAFGEGAILARLYDKRIIGNDICTDLLRLIGMDRGVEGGERRMSNVSLLAEFSSLVTRFDALSPEVEARHHFIDELLDLSRRFKPSAGYSLINDGLRALIIETYKVSNAQFAKRFLDAEQGRLLCQ